MVRKRRRLGWLGPIIFGVGVAASALAVWFMVTSKPTAGAVIETIEIGDGASIVVRAEEGGDRTFIELHEGGALTWQALVPPYAGRPGATGIAWSDVGVSVRVIRDGKAEVFSLARHDASKLGGLHLAPEHGHVIQPTSGPVTLTDHARAYELVAGEGWHQVVAHDLQIGKILWKVELGEAPITAGGIEGSHLWLEQGGRRRWFQRFDGREDRSSDRTGQALTD